MAGDHRLAVSRRWFDRGVASDDPFDRFVWLWIALELLVKTRVFGQRSGWRARTLDYFRLRSMAAVATLEEFSDDARWLAERISPLGRRVLDVSEIARPRIDRWAAHVTGESATSELELAEATGELLAAVRNNLFHGDKDYDAAREARLLRRVNPLLMGFIARSEGWEGARHTL